MSNTPAFNYVYDPLEELALEEAGLYFTPSQVVNSSIGAALPLSAVVAGALSSIGVSAKKISDYEKKFNSRRPLTLQEANPEIFNMPKRPGTALVPAAKKQKLSTSKTGGRSVSRAGGFVAAPASGGIITRPVVPRFNMRGDSTIVTNSELVLNVTPITAAFGIQSFSLIAAQPSWLAQIADNFSKWRWLSLRVIYSPKCPTTTSGTVAMCLSYDRNDLAPGSRIQLSQTYKAINFPPYAGYDGALALNTNLTPTSAIFLDVDVNRFDKKWYSTINLAAFAALTAFDQNQFCPCTVHVGSDGGPVVAVPPGDIYLKYVIELIEPINPTMNI